MAIYEYNIRQVLYDEFLNNKDFISEPDTIFVNELDICFGTARIDVAVINGKMHGFEIKSEQDNLERLPAQIEAYNKI
ncbi:MAG TPA: sce7726 family protein, partial [Thermoanaerobacter sp.]|nr:sce7726 family protein [Thermoanaerobacter sp.]